MWNTIPLSVLHQQDFNLLYFDTHQIKSPDKIEKAYIACDNSYFNNKQQLIEVFLNDECSYEDSEYMIAQSKKMTIPRNYGTLIADVSELLRILASGNMPNNGIILNNKAYLQNPRLLVYYHQDIIYPTCGCSTFFNKECFISSYRHKATSPWFYSGDSQIITFFAENLVANDVTIHLQNSPNSFQTVNDPQTITLQCGETSDIIPYRFSQFMRLVSHSEQPHIALKIWFQTQLVNV